MDIKLKKKIARTFAKTIHECDLFYLEEKTNEELRAILDARSKAMQALFVLGFDLGMDYKIILKGK
jgi:hypothetical protein